MTSAKANQGSSSEVISKVTTMNPNTSKISRSAEQFTRKIPASFIGSFLESLHPHFAVGVFRSLEVAYPTIAPQNLVAVA
ncbi:3681_t:CDS:2 [Paraglomus occultum]|uniref:3681_t:CDS:1 n=1 Tax=Paraglomus occultum TaxID=144539 RepID=A0A9N9G9Y3_9GLOM|nr:3681_t:CDS:2 [Paraglomus occultum]